MKTLALTLVVGLAGTASAQVKALEQAKKMADANAPFGDKGIEAPAIGKIKEAGAKAEQTPKADPAPDFELTGMNGQKITLAANKGKVVLLDFFATWCPPCRASTPVIVAMDKKLRAQGLKVIAIDMAEEKGTVGDYVKDHQMTYDVAIDARVVSRLYGVSGIPTFVVINKDGSIKAKIVGFDQEAVEKAVAEAMAGK